VLPPAVVAVASDAAGCAAGMLLTAV
jgi:hypothetical protein